MPEPTPKRSASSAKSSKVFDVTHPSETVASSTARPVIVGHTNMIEQDPMVSVASQPASVEPVASAQINNGTEQKPDEIIAKPKREKVLQPVGQEQKDKTAGVTNEDEQESEATVQPETGENTETDDNSAQAGSDAAAVDALVNEVSAKQNKQKASAEQQRVDEEVQKLIASKKYNVKTHLPPRKQKLRWLIVLIVLLALGGAGWYFGVGPGTDMWLKESTVSTPATTTEQKTTEKVTNTDTKAAPALSTFSNGELGIEFNYPKTWEIKQGASKLNADHYEITLSSPAEKLKTLTDTGAEVDAEVFQRLKIIVENTTDPTENSSKLAALSGCSSQDIVVAKSNQRLLFVSNSTIENSVSKLALSTENCTPVAGSGFTANDQVQFAGKANTYVFSTEYVFSVDHLKKNGTTDSAAIALAQDSGVLAKKSSVQSTKAFDELKALLGSVKEL